MATLAAHLLAGVALVGVGASLVYYGAAVLLAIRFGRRARSSPIPAAPARPPAVALLRPLYGASPALYDNLESLLAADYPARHFVFGVEREDDPAAEAVRRLAAKHPAEKIDLVVGSDPAAVNPKVGKLIRMLERTPPADAYVISDADIAVAPDYLRRVVAELFAHPGTGLVTCLYRGVGGAALGSRLQALFINTVFAPQVLISQAIERVRYAMGATMAIKREALAATGRLVPLRDKLADDYLLGRLTADHGYTVMVSTALVTSVCEESRIAEFWRHQLRWTITYHTVRPESRATILTNGPLWGLVLLACLWSWTGLGVALGVIAARLAMAVVLLGPVLRLGRPLRELWLVAALDLMIPALWLRSHLGRRVEWGGRQFTIGTGGVLREVDGRASGAFMASGDGRGLKRLFRRRAAADQTAQHGPSGSSRPPRP